jgi:hypothetical protein
LLITATGARFRLLVFIGGLCSKVFGFVEERRHDGRMKNSFGVV